MDDVSARVAEAFRTLHARCLGAAPGFDATDPPLLPALNEALDEEAQAADRL